MSGLAVQAYGISDRGLARSHNEDCYEIDSRQNLFLVADGMGGHRHGEVAARLAVDTMRSFIERISEGDATWPFVPEPRLSEQGNLLKMAVRLAHDEVMGAIRADRRLSGMGTTVVGMLFGGDTISVAHVGDSRAYRIRDGSIELLTQDHTWVHEQVVAGFLSDDQARVHPLKNVVTRALGGESELEVDVRDLTVTPGDTFILCSDGLTTMLDDEAIRKSFADCDSVKEAARNLVAEANARGGLDNVTVVIVRVEQTPTD